MTSSETRVICTVWPDGHDHLRAVVVGAVGGLAGDADVQPGVVEAPAPLEGGDRDVHHRLPVGGDGGVDRTVASTLFSVMHGEGEQARPR